MRAIVIRVGKAWKSQFNEPGICSFNVVALALESITEAMPIDRAMAIFYEHAAAELAVAETEDPARVSGPIHLEDRPGREVVVQRLRAAATAFHRALEHDDDEDAVVEALQPIFPDYVKPPTETSSKAALADQIRRKGTVGLGATGAGLAHGPAVDTRVKATRSYGADERPW